MICSMKYDASVDLWSVGVILYGKYNTIQYNVLYFERVDIHD